MQCPRHSKRNTMIHYWKSRTCGACQLMEDTGVIDAVRAVEEVKVHYVDDEDATANGIKSVPCIIVMSEGGSVRRFEGYTPAEVILAASSVQKKM